MHQFYILCSLILLPISIYRIYTHIYRHSKSSVSERDVSPTKKRISEPHTTPNAEDTNILGRQNQLLWALQNASEGYTPNSAKSRSEKILSIFSGTPNESEYERLESYRTLVSDVGISANEIFSLLEHETLSETNCIQDTRMLSRHVNELRMQNEVLQARMTTLEPMLRVARQRIKIAEENNLVADKDLDTFKRITLGQRHAAAMMLYQLEDEIRVLKDEIGQK